MMLLPTGFRTPVRLFYRTFVLTSCQRSNVRNVVIVTLRRFTGPSGRTAENPRGNEGQCYTRGHMGTDLFLGKDIR